MASEALMQDILREVAAHNGEWYWYQLNRRLLGIHPEVPDRLMVAIDELAAAGLIEVRPNPILGDIPRYWLTEKARNSFFPGDIHE